MTTATADLDGPIPPVEDPTRREFLAASAPAPLLAACGNGTRSASAPTTAVGRPPSLDALDRIVAKLPAK